MIPYFQELLVNLNYSDPQDAESDLALWPGQPGQGNVNQAYEAEDIVGLVSPPEELVSGHQPPRPPSRGQHRGYHVKLGHDIYYCKPYQPFHTQLRYNFSGQFYTHEILKQTCELHKLTIHLEFYVLGCSMVVALISYSSQIASVIMKLS